jgi:leucyl-tRNA---protein transferase
MFVDVKYPQYLYANELDDFLAEGWFRMGQSIFTTNFLRFHDKYYSALWLRIPLDNFDADKNQERLRKLNAHFNFEIKTLEINDEKEALFSKYKEPLEFEAASSLEYLLFHDGENDIYNTYEVNVYDGPKLIASGFFDLGEKSAAGITCFYDPEYKKHSLGKYLMLLKMEYCKAHEMEYFYPGYFVPGYPLFDYKLTLAKKTLEYYDVVSQTWLPIHNFSMTQHPLYLMEQRLKELCLVLDKEEIPYKFFYYDLFDANMMHELNGHELFDFPVFLFCFQSKGDLISPLVVYDVRSQNYQLLDCRSVFKAHIDDSTANQYRAHLLKVYNELLVSESAEVLASMMVALLEELLSKRKSPL